MVLTGLVAILALYVGITDYVHRKKDDVPATSESASTVVRSSAATVRKKIAKGRRARTPATESIDAASAVPVEGDDTGSGKQIIGEALGAALHEAPKSHHIQPAFDSFDGTLTSAACAPLPNSTPLITRTGPKNTAANWIRLSASLTFHLRLHAV